MKKIFLILVTAFLGCISCSDPKLEVYNPADGQIAYFTGGTTDDVYIQDLAVPQDISIEVGVTVASNVARTIAISADVSGNATADQYTIDNASLFIPANSYVGYIKLKGVYENLSQTVAAKLVLNLDAVSGAQVATFDNKYTLNLYQFTPFVRDEFIGTYKVIEYDEDNVVLDRYDSEITAGDNDNELIMGNIYNSDPGTQTVLIMDDSNPQRFRINFLPFLENFLFTSANDGDVFVEGFTGRFSAGLKTLDFTYRLRFGLDNTGSSNTATYRVQATKE
jgi:hypothetical protein